MTKEHLTRIVNSIENLQITQEVEISGVIVKNQS